MRTKGIIIMTKRQSYLDLLKKQQDEISNFPLAYAFNNEQLKEALEKIGAESLDECVTVMNHGDIVKREDAPKLIAMFKRHTKELQEAMENHKFAEAAFLYEMDNHEYAINWDGDDDVLRCFGMDEDDLIEKNLEGPYLRARRMHMNNAVEWGMI